MDAGKLRAYVSQYKRHSIMRTIRPASLDPHAALSSQQSKMRLSVADYLFNYTRNVLPRMEEKLELQLLEKVKERLGNDQEKKEVWYAYQQRKDNLAKLSEAKEIGVREKREEAQSILHEETSRVIMTVQGDGMSYHTFEDIGRYTVFPKQHYQRMFPNNKFFGNYEKDEFKYNQTFGVMTREEGLRITNELSRLSRPSERRIDYAQMVGFETAQIKEDIIKHE